MGCATISIGSNIPSLTAQRQLGSATASLGTTFERLSSGLRINRASDDAAGLAVASTLNADKRIYTQAARNLNDGMSALSIAQGALQQLSSITVRQQELAEQAANGTLNFKQRTSLTAEANALAAEFNRIVESADFNGRRLLDLSTDSVAIQAGYGSDGSILVGLGRELSRIVGTGSFQTAQDYVSTGGTAGLLAMGDLDGDGINDMVVGNTGAAQVSVLFGTQDGSFLPRQDIAVGGFSLTTLAVADTDGNGTLDVLAGAFAAPSSQVSIIKNNGDRSFQAPQAYSAATGINPISIAVGDVDGNGTQDIVSGNQATGGISVLLGNGNGTFQGKINYSSPSGAHTLALADMNGDGSQDVCIGGSGPIANGVAVLLGNGNGSFRQGASYALFAGGNALAISAEDLNGDGVMDLAAGSGTSNFVSVFLGNGDGSLRARTDYSTTAGSYSLAVASGDMNGDGNADISVGTSVKTVSTLLGNGDGTFVAKQDAATPAGSPQSMSLADINRDGALDIVAAIGDTKTSVLIANTTEATTIGRLDLYTQQKAREAMPIISATLDRVEAELGAVGCAQSRLQTALRNVGSMDLNITDAAGRIENADMAQESACLIRTQIIQQAASAVLGQANQSPSLALTLLR